MEKALRIEAFRNVGFKQDEEKKGGEQTMNPYSERLVLSNSLNKGEIGGLVIVIGANNSGKSNVIDALEKYKSGKFEQRDVTYLFMNEECRKPALSLSCKTDSGEEYSIQRKFGDSTKYVNYPGINASPRYNLKYVTAENILDNLSNLSDYERSYLSEEQFSDIIEENFPEEIDGNDEENLTKKIDEEKLYEIAQECFSVLSDYNVDYNGQRQNNIFYGYKNYRDFFSSIKKNEIYKEFLEYEERNKKLKNFSAILNEKFREKYGYAFERDIYSYEEEKISNVDLCTDYKNFENSKFFKELFNAIDIGTSEIKNAHKTFTSQSNNKGVLTQLEKKLNNKMKKVSKDFNKLYKTENTPYSFDISLESEKIFFSIFRGEKSQSLDFQSIGFRWFFNLYFNLLNSVGLEAGDIIIMDEPAMNLHVKGQREIREFLRDFAIANDINIVVATHSPFLIDMDFLEELRIVKMDENGISRIENKFTAVNMGDPDSLLPVKEALTVENHIIVDPDKKVIFVEGITDYNYLTAFKKILKNADCENLIFLPVNGVGKDKDERKKIIEAVLKIKKHNPIFLVDGDDAGKKFKEENESMKTDLEVICLYEVDDKFKTIESLFDKTDIEKFTLLDSDGKFIKHASSSSLFKNKVLKDNNLISDATKKNFGKLFKRLAT